MVASILQIRIFITPSPLNLLDIRDKKSAIFVKQFAICLTLLVPIADDSDDYELCFVSSRILT